MAILKSKNGWDFHTSNSQFSFVFEVIFGCPTQEQLCKQEHLKNDSMMFLDVY